MSFKIIGTGRELPGRMVTNDDLSKIVDTSDEWIFSRSGIKTRYISTGESALELGAGAARKALDDAGVRPEDLDLIICSTMQGDHCTPSLGCEIQSQLGAGCPAFDVNAACSGFIYALDIASGYFAAGRAKRVLVVSVDMMSRLLDWTDRTTCVLFGDGAGAVVLAEGDNLLTSFITAKGDSQYLKISFKYADNPFCIGSDASPYLYMDGREIFRFAVSALAEDIQRCIREAGITPEMVSWVIPHRANSRIIDSAAVKSGITREKFYLNLDKYGNTSSASIPIGLDELARSGKLIRGQLLIMSAFGGGLTTGGCVIRW
ncbi:MAG TPA: beta-ketoacyl-ACP synthase III [Clostridia bacterium]|nr:beta-ketoacyl-ACP synthase III [Clostridia bacterium]